MFFQFPADEHLRGISDGLPFIVLASLLAWGSVGKPLNSTLACCLQLPSHCQLTFSANTYYCLDPVADTSIFGSSSAASCRAEWGIANNCTGQSLKFCVSGMTMSALFEYACMFGHSYYVVDRSSVSTACLYYSAPTDGVVVRLSTCSLRTACPNCFLRTA